MTPVTQSFPTHRVPGCGLGSGEKISKGNSLSALVELALLRQMRQDHWGDRSGSTRGAPGVKGGSGERKEDMETEPKVRQLGVI